MKLIASAALAAAAALATAAVASSPPSLSADELARLHVAVISLMTHPNPDALSTIQETSRLLIERLDTVGPVSTGPATTN